ncbi:MAG TPA: hypothetical protein VK308_16560, partial [Pyrinomonadaceae bacterium]|nr:hypothetical protein [Pyrinomonadaceae bacterium]
IGLIIGLSVRQTALVLLTGFSCLIFCICGFEIHRICNEKIKKKLADLDKLESEAEKAKLLDERAGLEKEAATLKIQSMELWNRIWRNLTFGMATDKKTVAMYIEDNATVMEIYNMHDVYFPVESFVWFCNCAVEFYRMKGYDISELPVWEFEKRLQIDGFTTEFYEVFWTNHFITESARMNLASTLLIIRHFSGSELTQIPEPGQEKAGFDNAENQDETWADVVEVGKEYFNRENRENNRG